MERVRDHYPGLDRAVALVRERKTDSFGNRLAPALALVGLLAVVQGLLFISMWLFLLALGNAPLR